MIVMLWALSRPLPVVGAAFFWGLEGQQPFGAREGEAGVQDTAWHVKGVSKNFKKNFGLAGRERKLI